MIEKRGKRERKKRVLEPTQNNFAFGRRLRGDSVNFNMSYPHSLVCIGKRAAWGLGDFLKITAGSLESLASAQTCKVPDKCCHCKTFLSLPSCCLVLIFLSSCLSPIAETQTVTLCSRSAEECCSAVGGVPAEGQVSREGQPSKSVLLI